MKDNRKYQIKIEKDKLIFKTYSFRPEKTSILHKGVYTKEFSSMLFASAICLFAYMIAVFISKEISFIHALAIIFIFTIAFLISRKTLFKEKYIVVVFDKFNKTVSIIHSGIFKKKTEKLPLNLIKSIDVGSKKFTPENIDGIQFVKRISLQHGSFVPGLGDEEEFVTLYLKLTDGSERIIYAEKIEGKIGGEPELPLKEMKDFLGI